MAEEKNKDTQKKDSELMKNQATLHSEVVSRQEAEVSKETPLEKKAVLPTEKSKAEKETLLKPVVAPVVRPVPPSAPPPDPLTVQIEAILEEDLAAVYAQLPESLKPRFKQTGEETARKIYQMIRQAKVKARRVLKMILGWLKIIPGVNKFFLEQEAAIKTQKIVLLSKEKRQ